MLHDLNTWLQPTPVLVGAFLLACVVIPPWLKRRRERARVIRSDLGPTIPERADKYPIEES